MVSQLQLSVALSTKESFIVASELLWLKRLLVELGKSGKWKKYQWYYVEHASAVKLAKNQEFHKGSKHV
jgi:hypothetical protein